MKVRVLPLQPHCFAFGGFEIQMLSALEAVRTCGVDAQPMDIWSRNADFDILHVWGLDVPHIRAVAWARKAGKRVVATTLLPYITVKHRLYYLVSSLVGQVRLRRVIANMVDTLVVVNGMQADAAIHLLDVAQEKIVIIPNSVGAPFFERPARSAVADFGVRDYVLCVGNICERKNQVNLAKAALAAGCPLLIIGDVLTGEGRYADTLSSVIAHEPDIRWCRGLGPSSPELVSAYQGCVAFGLPSHGEQQPISVLEAAAMGKPILLANRPYARQKYYQNACLVEPQAVKSIQRGLVQITTKPECYIPPASAVAECRSEHVGQRYREVYEMQMMSKKLE